MKIAVLGSGAVGKTLAAGFARHGYEVMVASNQEDKRRQLADNLGSAVSVGSFQEAAAFGDCIVLAVKGNAAESCLQSIPAESLKGKIIIDTTNPIANTPPVQGVLSYTTNMNYSQMEHLQSLYPNARFVKAFNCIGSAHMVNPEFPNGKPAMFFCGNDESAREQVKKILEQFGHDPQDMGTAEAARAIEPLAMLWCIPGFRQNQWSHAFALLKK